jgi:tetratricopeptide (TPR) repeat protein
MPTKYENAINRANAHFRAGRYKAAAKGFRTAHRINPAEPKATYDLAQTLFQLAEADEAVALFERLRGEELHPSAVLGLSMVRPEAMNAADQDMMLKTGRTEAIGPVHRSRAYAALGRAWDAAGRWDDAFSAFAEAGRLMSGQLDLDRLAVQEVLEIERIERAFSKPFVARWKNRGLQSAAPIFVVGRPRSGTTLVEQILATHRSVQGMREPLALNQSISSRVYWPPAIDASPTYFQELGEDYLARMRREGWTRSRRFVDKFPQNYFYIGAIAMTFPNAVILNCVRDPMDTCFSWFRYVYDSGNEFSYDLAQSGKAYVRYRQVMDHWADVLPGRVIDVDYAALVADPEGQIRKLVTEDCGLVWDEGCLKFYENDRLVKTPSKFQVRQPIFDTSIGHWKHYERHLGPLIEALGPYGPKG